jgi:hypothetical protein
MAAMMFNQETVNFRQEPGSTRGVIHRILLSGLGKV